MKKIRLDIEALDVQSFATVDRREGGRGTVRGADSQVPWIPPTANASCQACETGNCLGTRFDPGCTGTHCELRPWTEGQDTCLTCLTCPGTPGC